jgi:ribosome-associated protein
VLPVVLVNEQVSIPEDELVVSFARSGGPGGQNVNKVNTKVLLRFDVAASPSLTNEQKARILGRLASKLDGYGSLSVVAQEHRSQAANRESAVAKLASLLADALKVPKKRVPTRISAAAHGRRLESKRRRSLLKRTRAGKDLD